MIKLFILFNICCKIVYIQGSLKEPRVVVFKKYFKKNIQKFSSLTFKFRLKTFFYTFSYQNWKRSRWEVTLPYVVLGSIPKFHRNELKVIEISIFLEEVLVPQCCMTINVVCHYIKTHAFKLEHSE